MVSSRSPELSVIVPVLDEVATLPSLFATLASQQAIAFELILCDGGSADGTLENAQLLAKTCSFPCQVARSGKGRGRQMNAGASLARSDDLLFLHADSQFPDPLALSKGLIALRNRCRQRCDARVAGRFALRFRRSCPQRSLAYYFYENKARLDRPGCIHGDQGFLLQRSFFNELGAFEAQLSLFEDDRLAAQVFRAGEWLLLPAEISSSARRFETEGLRQRQTLNALLCNFADIGWDNFFRSAQSVYRQQSRTRSLRLYPYFRLIRTLLDCLSWRERRRLWYRTGAFVRANAWQIAYYFDVKKNFRRQLPAGAGSTPTLRFFERHLDPLIDHPAGRLTAAVLTWSWFHVLLWRLHRDWQRAPALEGESHASGDH